MNFESLKIKRQELVDRARSLKTKKAQSRAWRLVSDIEREMHDLVQSHAELVDGTTITGEVRTSGYEVMVRTAIGNIMVYGCNDVLSKSWYSETCCVSYERGQQIEGEVFVTEVSWRGYSIGLKNVKGGSFDDARYLELSQNPNLAFFKYPTGMSGLFSTKNERGGLS